MIILIYVRRETNSLTAVRPGQVTFSRFAITPLCAAADAPPFSFCCMPSHLCNKQRHVAKCCALPTAASASASARTPFMHPFHVACGGRDKLQNTITRLRACMLHKTLVLAVQQPLNPTKPSTATAVLQQPPTTDDTKRRAGTATILKSSLARKIRGGKKSNNTRNKERSSVGTASTRT